MGLFRRKGATAPTRTYTLPATAPAGPTMSLPAAVDVVGESNYVAALFRVVGGGTAREVVGVLLPEPANPHDARAVAVYVGADQVGYLSRDDAKRFRSAIDSAVDAAGCAAVAALVYRGGDAASVVLQPDRLAAVSRPRLVAALAGAGFATRVDEGPGFTMREEASHWRVFWAGGTAADRDENIPAMAKALRDAGYDAKGASEDGYRYVRVKA